MLNSKWFLEQTTDHEGSFHSLEEIIYAGNTRYQHIEIVRIGSYGKCLVIDGKIQSSEVDEFIYHEALVHPTMLLADSCNKILIAGGGEGAVAREVLKHPSVSDVTIVDLDEIAVALSKQYLLQWHRGAFQDSRVRIFHEDARKFIERHTSKFDVIIIDLPEPSDGGPAFLLYTKEFYDSVYNCLNEGGAMVTQATSASVNNLKVFAAIVNTVKEAFPYVNPYVVNIPSFFAPWGFVLSSKKRDILSLSRQYIEDTLDRLTGELRFYDYETHQGMFSLPKYLRNALKQEDFVIKDSSPISFYPSLNRK
ncbi:spermidine synthase [hot springs metagenome]|uniref:thermospermine synthase n=1 Tax=hot springs metagenome TaxID=433727 RepID=A0A5J4L215_9ZZZZ